MENRRFLIIGASGFIGQNLQSYLGQRGYEVVGTQARQRPNGLVKFELLEDRIDQCVERDFLARPSRLEVVISAAVCDMDRCLTEREKSYRINVENTIRLIEDLTKYQARVTFLSTNAVFDGRDGYYNESDPPTPVNEYGRHKWAVEEHLRENHPKALVLRLDKIIGDNPGQNQMLAHWYQLAVAGKPIVSIQGLVMAPTDVLDVVAGIEQAARRELAGLYHLANPEFFHRQELAYQFCRALGLPRNVEERPLESFGFPDSRGLKAYLNGAKFTAATGLQHTRMHSVFKRFAQNT